MTHQPKCVVCGERLPAGNFCMDHLPGAPPPQPPSLLRRLRYVWGWLVLASTMPLPRAVPRAVPAALPMSPAVAELLRQCRFALVAANERLGDLPNTRDLRKVNGDLARRCNEERMRVLGGEE